MRYIAIKDIKDSSYLDEQDKERVGSLLRHLRKNDVLSIWIESAVRHGFCEVPSVFRDGMARCSSSFFTSHNVLQFCCGDECFFIVQNSSYAFPFLIYIPGLNVFISNRQSDASHASLVKGIESHRRIFPNTQRLPFGGVLNFYNRPYHYFYDKCPFLINLITTCKVDFPVVSIAGVSFIEISHIAEKSVNEVVFPDVTSFKAKSGFYIDSSRAYSPDFNSTCQRTFKRYVLKQLSVRTFASENADFFADKHRQVILWLGVCGEKRAWIEYLAAYSMIIRDLQNTGYSVKVVFDGMTSALHDDVDTFRSRRCTNEIAAVDELSKLIGTSNVLDLVGHSAEFKIYAASRVNFFISNALTDSIWPAFFNGKRGLCYCSNGSRITDHHHPATRFFPQDKVKNIEDGETNWSKVSFSIEPNLFFSFYKEYKDEMLGI